jgi:hypothetical protein
MQPDVEDWLQAERDLRGAVRATPRVIASEGHDAND